MVLQLGEDIRNMGYEVIVPKEFLVEMGKKEASMLHFGEIAKPETDAILVVNEDKEDIQNYVGPNSFAEVALAFYFGKKVFLKNDIYEPYRDELEGWEVIPLKGNLEELFKQI